MKNVFQALVAVAMLLAVQSVRAEMVNEGYSLLIPPQPAQTRKIEVLEFFSYQCPHCYHLHGPLSVWAKAMPGDVELTYVPVPGFRASWEHPARAYYALESMGKIRKLDDVLYDAINNRTADLYDIDSYADFVARNGVDRAAFVAAMTPGTFSGGIVDNKVRAADRMTKSYGIEGTPTLVVDGKFLVRAQMNPQDTLRALNAAIAQARKERAGKR